MLEDNTNKILILIDLEDKILFDIATPLDYIMHILRQNRCPEYRYDKLWTFDLHRELLNGFPVFTRKCDACNAICISFINNIKLKDIPFLDINAWL
jgi:hypothetical protein